MFAKILFSALLASGAAQACPVNLAHSPVRVTPSMSLCEAWDRYYMASWQLRAKGVAQPRTIGNVMAPRFINRPDWLAKRTEAATSATTIYDPAPTTWDRWEEGADVVDARASLNNHRRTFPALDIDWLLKLHGKGLAGLNGGAGHFRQGEEIGAATNDYAAMSRAQLAGLRSLPFHQLSSGQPLVRFRPSACWQEQTIEFRKQRLAERQAGQGANVAAWARIPDQQFFKGRDGQDHQCGFIVYTPRVQIQEQLDLLIKTVNEQTAHWSPSELPTDPIALAALAQRWFISIHPFSDGNGRVSRYIMDLLIESLGLPAPILEDMNNDLYSTNEGWRDEVGRGIERAVIETEQCARDPRKLGCAAIDTGVAAGSVIVVSGVLH